MGKIVSLIFFSFSCLYLILPHIENFTSINNFCSTFIFIFYLKAPFCPKTKNMHNLYFLLLNLAFVYFFIFTPLICLKCILIHDVREISKF